MPGRPPARRPTSGRSRTSASASRTFPLTLPIALRRLGELAEQRGDLADAIRRYRAFAYLWRNADPELQPQVAEIRARLARLEAREARSR